MRRWIWSIGDGFFLVMLVVVVVLNLGVGGRGAVVRRSSSGSGWVLNPVVGDDGGVGVGGGGEENGTLALPLALVSRTRSAVLFVFLSLRFVFPPFLLLPFYFSSLPISPPVLPMTDQPLFFPSPFQSLSHLYPSFTAPGPLRLPRPPQPCHHHLLQLRRPRRQKPGAYMLERAQS